MISCINIVKMKWNKMRQLLQSLQEEDWYSKPAFWCYWIYCTKVLRIKCNDIRCFLAHEKRGSHIDNYLGANCKIKRNAHAQQGEIKLSNSCIWFGTCQIRRLTPRRSCVALCDWNSRILSFKSIQIKIAVLSRVKRRILVAPNRTIWFGATKMPRMTRA